MRSAVPLPKVPAMTGLASLQLAVLGCANDTPVSITDVMRRVDALLDDGAHLQRGKLVTEVRRLSSSGLLSIQTAAVGAEGARYTITGPGRDALISGLRSPEQEMIDRDSFYNVLTAFLHLLDSRAQSKVLSSRVRALEARTAPPTPIQLGGPGAASALIDVSQLRRERRARELEWHRSAISRLDAESAVHRFLDGEIPDRLLVTTSGSVHVPGCRSIPGTEVVDRWERIDGQIVTRCLGSLANGKPYNALIGRNGDQRMFRVSKACRTCLPGVTGPARSRVAPIGP